MMVDKESEVGAWEREWDARSHTVSEYQHEVRDLRDRIKYYVSRIRELEEQLQDEQARNSEWVREP